MAFMINSHRRFRPQTEPMLAHAGHWYLSQAWAKALTWVWNETTAQASCGQFVWSLQGTTPFLMLMGT